jgi:O-antigen/teichoic acid export membrane protein
MKLALRKLFSLTLTHLATFAFPLAFAVVCGRVLGVHNYGIVSFYTALAAFLGVVIEFGFDWLGIREVARTGDDPAQRGRILWNVTAAKLLLCLVACCIVAAALIGSRGAGQTPLVLAMVAFLFGFALDISWYLRALERVQALLLMTAFTRAAGVVLLWVAVAHPGDIAPALWSYAFVSLSQAVCGWFILTRQGLAGPPCVEWRRMVGLMRKSWAILFGNLNGALLTNGGVALLGLLGDPATVGAANLALRVKMAGQAVLLPINQLGYVRLSALAASDRAQALRVGRISLAALMAVSSAIGLAIVWLAPHIVQYVFRAAPPVAVGLVMLLGLSVPINAAAGLLGMQSLIAFGRERSYALIVAISALVFCTLLFALQGELSYGWALLGAESAMLLMAALRLRAVLIGEAAHRALRVDAAAAPRGAGAVG